MMRAVAVMAPGAPGDVTDQPIPEAAAGEVLVRVAAAALNPIDTLIAKGALAAVLEHQYPLVLGRDASGVVVGVGDGVEGIATGDEVLGHVPLAPPLRMGTLAEWTVLPAAYVAVKPSGLDHVTAAALPLSGTAALTLVDAIDPHAGDVVLVNGASGGVGSYVVQLLARRGAEVIATGTRSDVERLRQLGASHVVDFTRGPVAEQVLAIRPEGGDSLVNLHGMTIEQVPLAAVRRGGRVATLTSAPKADALEAAGLVGGIVQVQPRRDVLIGLAEMVTRGDLIVGIDRTIALGDAVDALATIAAGGAHGKFVVDLGT